MKLRKVQYTAITAIFAIALITTLFFLFSWNNGDDVAPVTVMNSIVFLGYMLCMIGFNWANSKRLVTMRIVGVSYSLVMMVASLLIVNNVFPFANSWHLILAGLSVSLALSGMFQVFRVRGFSSGTYKAVKYIVIGFTALVFGALGFVYLTQHSNPNTFSLLKIVLMVYSATLLLYFGFVMFRAKDDRSMPTK